MGNSGHYCNRYNYNCLCLPTSTRKPAVTVWKSIMIDGTVRWFNQRKGFGFIATEDGPDIFVHYSAIESIGPTPLNEGDKVEFEIVQGEKGPKAAHVVRKDAE